MKMKEYQRLLVKIMSKLKINANILKIFAITVMLIDHIGCYFVSKIALRPYYIIRSIGRLAMPIFLYLIVQGFFYTSNLKKYRFRVFCLATITQIILIVLGIINEVQFPSYICRENEYLGVLFSYTLSLILIAMLEYKKPLKKANTLINFIFRIVVIFLIAVVYINIDIEFDMRIPFMFIEIYVIEKIFMDKENHMLFLKRKFENKWKKAFLKIIYVLLIEFSFLSSLDFSAYHPGYKYAIAYTAIPLLLYNGEKGKNNRLIKILFYAIFPLQHLIFYLSGMIICS